MTIGDKVTATNRLVKQRHWVDGRTVISWIVSPFPQPVPPSLFLGRTLLYTGHVVLGDEYEPNQFTLPLSLPHVCCSRLARAAVTADLSTFDQKM